MDSKKRLKALVTYIIVPLLFLGASIIFDIILVLPLVEVDAGLTMEDRGSEVLHRIRELGTMIIPLVICIGLFYPYLAPIFRYLKNGGPMTDKVGSRVTRAPQFLGFFSFSGAMLSFLFITVVDLMIYRFPVGGERSIYVLTTFIAMFSSGILSFLVIYISVDFTSRRLMIPLFFPKGNLSTHQLGKPMTFMSKLIILWLAIGVYPITVLSLGFYPRDISSGLQNYAWTFSSLMIPIGFFLVFSLAKAFHNPVMKLVKATKEIAQEKYDIDLISQQNDELGFLIDQTADMAKNLEEKQRIKETFGRAVDPRVRDHLLRGNITLGGERKMAAVLFCDIRGFTTMSEKRNEVEVVNLLNHHLAAMEQAISQFGGMINKFMGDGFLALFGLPVPVKNPGQMGFSASLAMIEANNKMNEELIANGEDPLDIGIGLHYGPLLAGNIGTPNRMEYTVIGDGVNLSSRIQEFSKKHRGKLFFTQQVYDQLDVNKSKAILLGRANIRGRQEQVNLWSI